MNTAQCGRYRSCTRFVLSSIALAVGTWASAQSPEGLALQGYLTDGSGTPLTGRYGLTFRLYDHLGTELLTNSLSDVEVTDGIYNVDVAEAPIRQAAPTVLRRVAVRV